MRRSLHLLLWTVYVILAVGLAEVCRIVRGQNPSALHNVTRLNSELDGMIRQGLGDSDEADELREQVADEWDSLNKLERHIARQHLLLLQSMRRSGGDGD